MNYFDDKRMQCSDKITTYPYGYFNNNSCINSEIKANTVKLNEIDNSCIITKNDNTKDSFKNTNATLGINQVIEINTNCYTDSAKIVCVDQIKSTNANNNYRSFIKTFCASIIKKACNEIINEATSANNTQSACIDHIKSTKYIDIIKSKCNDTRKKQFYLC